MNELIQTFNFGATEVRTAIKDNGDVYFCLKDIATVLGIQDTQTKNFNLDEKGVHKMYTPTKGGGKIPTPTQAGIDKCAVLT